MSHDKPPEPVKKIGQGHASAMLRQGFKELQAAAYFDTPIAREPEPGTFGCPTQGEIAVDRKADCEPSIIDQHAERARSQRSKQPDREAEPERD